MVPQPPTVREVNPREAHEMQRAGALLLDVREPDEHAEARIPGAMLVPLGELAARVQELPAGRTLVVTCRSGARSRVATEALLGAGRAAVNLRGGLLAWAQAGLPVER